MRAVDGKAHPAPQAVRAVPRNINLNHNVAQRRGSLDAVASIKRRHGTYLAPDFDRAMRAICLGFTALLLNKVIAKPVARLCAKACGSP